MRPFLFDVEAGQAATVAADFAMPDMDMLPNRYQLARMDRESLADEGRSAGLRFRAFELAAWR